MLFHHLYNNSMANQALINAAQRMYSAKAQQTDITPITGAISSSVANITKAVQEKRTEQEENSKKPFKSFKKILLENPDARPQMQQELDKLQEEYFQNIKKSEKLFGNKQEKQDAINANNDISVALAAWEKDLASIDEKMLIPSNPSKFNSLPEQVNNVASKDGKNLSGRLIFKGGKDAGVYTKDAFGKEVRLSEFGGVSEVNVEGFDNLVATRQNTINAAKKGVDWDSEAKPSLEKNLNKLMLDDNWGSLLFDELDGYSWATQQMQDEKVEDIELFKLMVKSNPEKYKKEYIKDVLDAYKLEFDQAKLKAEQEEGGSERDLSKSLNSLKLQGVPVNLRALTGDPSDEYLRVQLNKEGNYDLISSTTRQPLKTGDSASDPVITYTPEQLAAMIGVDVSELTGKPVEATTDTTPTSPTDNTNLGPTFNVDNIVPQPNQNFQQTPLPKKGNELKVENKDGQTIVQGVVVDGDDYMIYDRFNGSLWNPSRWFRGKPNAKEQQAIKRIQDALKNAKSNELDDVITKTQNQYGFSDEAFEEFKKYPTAKGLDEAYKEGRLKNTELIAWVEKNIQNVAT
jgi:hypothetical protein